jgi:chemotaxis protein MotB
MIRFRHWSLQFSVLVFALVVSAGCTTKRLGVERDRLVSENRDLRSAIDLCEQQRSSAEAERDRLAQEVSRLQQMEAPVGIADTSGFEAIQGVEVEQMQGMIKVKVPGDVLFAPGKTSLRSASKRTLDQIADVISAQYQGNTIGVEGHTDTDPIRKSKWTDNLELSLQRAAAVNRYLQSKGVSPKNMYAAGWGETHPQATKAKSRRVEIVVLTG